MNTAPSDVEKRNIPEEELTDANFMVGGSAFATAAGIAAVALAIVGLAGVLRPYLLTIATICIGGALLMTGIAVSSRYSNLVQDVRANRRESAKLWGGMSAEFLGGAAGVILGILGLLGIDPISLAGVAAIVLGGAFLLGTGTLSGLNNLANRLEGPQAQHRERILKTGIGLQSITGLAAIALGIVGLAGVVPMILFLVAMLALGVGIAVSEGSMGGKMLSAEE